jgi:hypothetical protein
MELKVFWGMLYARGYRQLNSNSLDPDGCLVRSSNFVLIKKRNLGCKTKAAGSSRVVQCKQDKIFVTGEVCPIDIGLLMGAVSHNWLDF